MIQLHLAGRRLHHAGSSSAASPGAPPTAALAGA